MGVTVLELEVLLNFLFKHFVNVKLLPGLVAFTEKKKLSNTIIESELET